MFSNGKAVDPWRTKPLQIADLSWQVQDVFFDFLMCWFDGSFFLSGDIPDVLMDGPLFFLRGGGGLGVLAISKEKNPALQKLLKKKPCKWSHGEKIEQAFSTFQVLCLTLKKLLHKLLSTKNNHARP